MRIAQIAPIVERVPPKTYGGTERVVSALTEELVNRGHDVTLFASGDSITKAKLESTYPTGLREAHAKELYNLNLPTRQLLGRAYAHAADFDVIHDHTGLHGLPLANLSSTPVVMTLHGNVVPEEQRLYFEFSRPHLVPISKSLRATVAGLNVAGFVYNGLPMEHYPFGADPKRYLLYVGRICKEKGTHNAIAVAKRLNLPLIIAAKLEHIERDLRYYRKYVRPHLGDQIKWVGEVNEIARNELMANALCFLHSIEWAEPFGLTLIEAMACGAPVIAFNKGSISEIVLDGRTGFVVDNIDQMTAAVLEVGSIERAACRAHVLVNFNEKKMTDGYEAIYQKVVSREFADLRAGAPPAREK